MGQVGGVLVPLALLTYHSAPWIMPILASIPFGTGIYLIFMSSFTYIIAAYRPHAVSVCERVGMEDEDAYGIRGGVSAVCPGRCTALLAP
jgi:hypothetical protein